ncbi:MAG: AsmA family protein [Rhodanobacteraceae bacterium]
MHMLTPLRRHPWRSLAVACVVVIIALIVALVIYVHHLLQPQRFTALLEGDLSAAGLTLKLQAPAEPTLFPHPGVRLEGFSLSNTGASTPLLTANAATIVVPWRALLHGDAAIERVDIDSPRVDLGELEKLLARLPHHAGPPHLPTIATGVHMSQGTLTNDGTPLLFGASLETGSLAPGQRFRLFASARSQSGRELTLGLSTVPSPPHDGAIDFASIQFRFGERGGTVLQLAGHGSWRGGENLALQLSGTLQHASFAPAPASASGKPPASASADNQTTTDKITLDIAPQQGATPMTVALKLDGTDAHVDAHLQPTEFGNWWRRLLASKPGQTPVPLPFTGTANIERVELGPFKATGLHIEAGPNLAPASAGSAVPAPASTAATTH